MDLGAPPTTSAAGPAPAPAQKLSPLTPDKSEFAPGSAPEVPPEFDGILSRIVALRSRVQALTATLFKSRVRVLVEARGEVRIHSLRVLLDDGVVFAAPERVVLEEERVVYEGAVAPGQHVLGLEVERYDQASRQYRTWQTSHFALPVPEGQLVEAELLIEDDSDMAEEFPEDQAGEYDLRVRLKARVTSR